MTLYCATHGKTEVVSQTCETLAGKFSLAHTDQFAAVNMER
jgi:hypothetical protein